MACGIASLLVVFLSPEVGIFFGAFAWIFAGASVTAVDDVPSSPRTRRTALLALLPTLPAIVALVLLPRRALDADAWRCQPPPMRSSNTTARPPSASTSSA